MLRLLRTREEDGSSVHPEQTTGDIYPRPYQLLNLARTDLAVKGRVKGEEESSNGSHPSSGTICAIYSTYFPSCECQTVVYLVLLQQLVVR